MKKEDCYILGKIIQPHGVKGEVKLWLDVDDYDYYTNLDSVLLDLKGQLVPYFVEELTVRDKKKTIARFEGMKTWEDTQEIMGCEMYLPLSR
ncbi:MAG: 16S rRNA processing protein RimM, partial [Spirosomataceae bacterium]